MRLIHHRLAPLTEGSPAADEEEAIVAKVVGAGSTADFNSNRVDSNGSRFMAGDVGVGAGRGTFGRGDLTGALALALAAGFNSNMN